MIPVDSVTKQPFKICHLKLRMCCRPFVCKQDRNNLQRHTTSIFVAHCYHFCYQEISLYNIIQQSITGISFWFCLHSMLMVDCTRGSYYSYLFTFCICHMPTPLIGITSALGILLKLTEIPIQEFIDWAFGTGYLQKNTCSANQWIKHIKSSPIHLDLWTTHILVRSTL